MKSKLKTVIIIKLLILSISTYCQDFNLLTKPEFQNYIQQQDFYYDSIVTIKGTESGIEGYKAFKRWKDQYQELVYNDDGLQNVLEAQHYYNRNYQSIVSNHATYNANWEEMGPFDVPPNHSGNYTSASGTGRIFSIAFDPDNSNRIFAGSPTGGLFVSHDYGENWAPAGTDLLPTPGMSHFVLVPETENDPETWFVLTGDGDNKWTFSYGIFRSQNKGQSWEDVSGGIYFPNLDYWNQSIGRKMLHHPVNPDQMLVIYNYGLYKTNNAMDADPANVIWTEKIDGHFTDICAKPNTNNQVIYATSRDIIYISNDYGENWSPMPNLQQVNFMDNSANRRVTLRTTPDNPNVLYAVIISKKDSAHSQIYKYNSTTQNWTPKGSLMTGDTAVGWGRYQSFEVSPNNEDHLYQARVFNIRKSTDGGVTWFNKSGAKHPDTHWITFDPNNYTKMWIGTDGGVSYSPNDCDTLYYKTKGLSVGNINRISTAETLSDFVIYGGFDTGSALNENNDNTWRQLHGGDAYGSVIDDTDPNNPIYYVSSNGSSPSKSTNGGVSFTSVSVPETIRTSGWNHCIIKDFDTQSTLYYAGRKRIGRTINGGNSWEPISPIAGDSVVPVGNGQTDTVNYNYWEVFNSKNHPNYLYTYRSTGIGDWDDNEANRVYKSTNANAIDPSTVSWTDISPVINSQLIDNYWWADIAVNHANPDEIWLCRSGYGNSDPKILHYENNTWSDITSDVNSTLDNLSVISIKHVAGVDDLLIIGTNAGVYFRSNSNPVWTKMLGLPNIRVKNILIKEKEKKILLATYGRGVWKGDIPCILPGNDYNITTNTTWDSDTIFAGNVHIKQGARLTINPCLIQFAPGKKLIVEQGAELFINGATLDSRCNEVWGGIEVWGNSSLSQSPSSNQGAVRTYSGTVIKNAVCGIRALKYIDEPLVSTSGGIIIAIGTQFINNGIGISIPYYSAFSNTSIITNCKFKITDNISSDIGMPIGIYLVAGTNVAITDNDFLFENTTEELRLRAIGIKNFGASATINKRTTGNQFSGWNYGIYSSGIYGSDHVFIRDNSFEDCITGVYMSGNANCEIIFNEFNIPMSETEPHFAGLYLNNCNSFTVEENHFQGNYHPMSGGNYIGMVINNSGPYINEVYKNTFDQLTYAVLAQNQNRASNGDGLSFKCNTFTDNAFDISAVDETAYTGIAEYQGSIDDAITAPAGNQFSYTGPSGTPTDINNQEQQIIYYYHNEITQDRLIPQFYINTTLEPNIQTWVYEDCCPSNYGGGGSGGIEEIRGLMTSSGQTADSINNIIVALEDGGNTEELSGEVYTSTPPETMVVYNELMGTSPYLSDSVVETAIYKEEVLPNAMIRDVMVANPQSAKNNELMEAVDDRSDAMPDYMKAQILQGKSIISAFEQLKSNYAYHKNLSNKAYQQAKNWYLSDTLNPEQSYDSLLSLLAKRHEVNAKYQLVSYYMQNNEVQSAANQLNDIQNQLELSYYEQAEYIDMQNLYILLFNMQQNNLNFTELNNDQLSLLEDMELEGNGRVQQYARNIRLNLGLSDYVEPYIIPDLNKSTEIFNFETELLKSMNEVKYLEVFPNPAKDYVILKYLVENNVASSNLQITNASSKVLETFEVIGSEDQIVIDTKNYKSGVYIASLFIKGEVAESVKFNIIK